MNRSIHLLQCVRTMEVWPMICPYNTDICTTLLIPHSAALYCQRVFTGYFKFVIHTKLISSVDMFNHTSLGFPIWQPESTRPTDLCFQDPSWENIMMYSLLYQHTRVVLYTCMYINEYLICQSSQISSYQRKTFLKLFKLLYYLLITLLIIS